MAAIYQCQSLKFHHGKIQGEKYQDKDNKRTHER